MTTVGWVALGLALGSAAAFLAMRPLLARRYREGRADGYVARFEDEKPRRDAAYEHGRRDGWEEISRLIARDLGAAQTLLMLERIEAMNKVDAIMGGTRT